MDTEPGQFTEMIIGLPLTRPTRTLGGVTEEEEDEEAEEALDTVEPDGVGTA